MEENSHEQTGLPPAQAMRTLTATPAMRAVAGRAAEDELIASIEREERAKVWRKCGCSIYASGTLGKGSHSRDSFKNRPRNWKGFERRSVV